MKKNKKRTIIFLILISIISALYFLVPIIVMADSYTYYRNSRVICGMIPLSRWNLVRGFGLPSVLAISTTLFGDTAFGVLSGTYVFYLLFNILYFKIICNLVDKTNKIINKVLIYVVYLIFILFNPIIFGYYHGLLTEFVALTLSIYSCYISYKFLQTKVDYKNVKTYLYYLFYIVLFIFTWFLKQPYFTIAFFPLCAVILISIFKYKSFSDFLKRLSVLVISSACLFVSITGWSKFLDKNGVITTGDGSNSNFLKGAVFNGISNFRILEYSDAYTDYELIKNDPYIKKSDKKLIKLNKKFKIVELYNSDRSVKEKFIIYYKGEDYEINDSLKFYFMALKKYPFEVIDSYYNNYLAMIDIYVSQRAIPDNYYYPAKIFDKNFNHENMTIGLSFLNMEDNKNYKWLDDTYMDNISNLKSKIDIPEKVSNMILKVSDIFFWGFKIAFLGLPFITIFILIKYIVKKEKKENDEFALLLLLFAFLHSIFHVVTGAIIDRYVFVVFPEVILGYLLLIPNKKKIFSIKEKEVLRMKKTNKSIFVIPAYNESKHIEAVIKDIRKNMPESDIVVTNDYSKDNTREVVENLGVPCLNVPFNMGYAMAVQTGIKYAYENDYDYVIQFDADGQHLASEVKKLFKVMKKTNANIVIGSRFLEETGYKHPFFRKVGTKMFSIIIKMFCKKNITDPTSGFQLLDRSVIERYSKIGQYPEFPDANLIIEMLLEGYKIEEISVKMKECEDGVSMHGGIIKPIKYMVKVTYTIVFILLRGFGNRRSK